MRAWLEHLPHTANMNRVATGYMKEVRRRNKVARDAGEAKAKQAMGSGAFSIDSPYGSIAILAFSALCFYWVCVGFIQFCHNLGPWTKWLFGSLF